VPVVCGTTKADEGLLVISPVAAARVPGPEEAWVGLGSNLGDRAGHLHRALGGLRPWIVAESPVFETEPWGIREQPWFLNMVVRLSWTAPARDLLALCLEVELERGRVRDVRNGPRTLDLDVLLLGDERIDEPGLTIPHPGIASRRSVLDPWALVAPELLVPGVGMTIGALAARARALPGQAVRPAPGDPETLAGTIGG